MADAVTPTLDPRMAELKSMMPQRLLERHARERADRVFVQFDGGETWSYRDFRQRVMRAAYGLQQLGLGQGQHAVTWVPNGPEALVLWFAINQLGAVYVPLNTAYRGRLLEHALDIADGAILIAHSALIDRLSGFQLPRILVSVGDDCPAADWIPISDVLSANGEPEAPNSEIMPWDTQSIVFTSGTTGPSKGVCQSYLQQYTIAIGAFFLSESDRCLMTLPLYHQGGITGVNRMYFCGGSIAMAGAFNTAKFWPTVRRTQSTCATLMGTMAKFLVKQPPSPEDRDHTLRSVIIAPLEEQEAFKRRFGVDVYSIFNMTELGSPLVTEANPTLKGPCGRMRPGFQLRIVDENDCEVPCGSRGELIVRHEIPWTQTSGYLKNPEATAKAWRNGWFHTGDCFWRDEDGNYFFADRLKDAVRRRGENISSFEVETEIMEYPTVREAAVIGVPSADSEEDLMAVLVPLEGAVIDPAKLLEFLRSRMPHFMIPRFIRMLEEMPKTASHKIQKQVLRDEGVTPTTWDRETSGIRIRRDRI